MKATTPEVHEQLGRRIKLAIVDKFGELHWDVISSVAAMLVDAGAPDTQIATFFSRHKLKVIDSAAASRLNLNFTKLNEAMVLFVDLGGGEHLRDEILRQSELDGVH